MTNDQQAEMAKFNTVKIFINTNEDAYHDDVPFKKAVVAFMASYGLNLDAAAKAFPNNKGFSIEKKNGKIKLSKNASNLAGRAHVTLKAQDETTLLEKLLTFPSAYMDVADSQCGKLAQEQHDLMSTNIDLLTDYVSAPQLLLLQTDITNFLSLQGTSELEHEASPDLTKKFVKSFYPVRHDIADLKFLARVYEDSDNDFFTKFMTACGMPVVNIHHTYVAIHATGADSGKAIENIVFTLTNAKKSATTDWEGNALIEEVKAGKDVLTGVYNGKTVYVGHITILIGKTVSFNLKIEGL
jgi:hypothetical protein